MQRTVFIGEYQHSIDAKKRVALPARFRDSFGGKAVLTRGLDTCLFVYPIRVWEEIATRLGNMPIGEQTTRSFVRIMLAGAIDVDVDSQGRVLVPEYLKSYAKLEKHVVVAGLFNRLEFWDTQEWEAYKHIAEKNQQEIAEQLGKLGVY